MYRTDYERFLQVAPGELGKDYFLQTQASDPYYPYCYAKIRKNGTVYREKNLLNAGPRYRRVYRHLSLRRLSRGKDGAPASGAQSRLDTHGAASGKRICFPPKGGGSLRKAKRGLEKLLALRGREKLRKAYYDVAVRYNGNQTGLMCTSMGANQYGKWADLPGYGIDGCRRTPV